eukprot:gnl/Chilomastix_caulleri/2835.p1 GENE.gnl/Chilomastix_caulleri/2835~~gnl/Chilomastix_caulleri/2835.p1  ORF type:complete len:54 (+),score=3.04 gnl/Chilomastix_caulleri/2835:147-308(+)
MPFESDHVRKFYFGLINIWGWTSLIFKSDWRMYHESHENTDVNMSENQFNYKD